MNWTVFSEVNIWAIIVATVIYYIFGALWYGIFGEQWMSLIGKTMKEIQNGSKLPYLYAFIGAGLLVYCMAVVFNAFSITGLGGALLLSVLFWLAFIFMVALKHYGYEGRPMALLLLDYGYEFVGFIIIGTILGLWR